MLISSILRNFHSVPHLSVLFLTILLVACGGGGGDDSPNTSGDVNVLTVKLTGTVSGLDGTLTLTNGSQEVTATGNGSVTIDAAIAEGTTYNIQVTQQPLKQVCLVEDAVGVVETSDIQVTVQCNEATFLSLTAADTGKELWKTDGTTAGTQLVVDALPGGDSSVPVNPIIVNDHLMFLGRDALGQLCLYSKASDSGTAVKLKVVDDDADDFPIDFEEKGVEAWLNAFDGLAYFFVRETIGDRDDDYQLWRSDGTVAGTQEVNLADFGAANFTVFPRFIMPMNNYLLMTAYDAESIPVILSFDGSQFKPLPGAWVPGGLTVVGQRRVNTGDKIYYIAEFNGIYELAVTDGTAEGTINLVELRSPHLNTGMDVAQAYGTTYIYLDRDLYKIIGDEAVVADGWNRGNNSFHSLYGLGNELYYYGITGETVDTEFVTTSGLFKLDENGEVVELIHAVGHLQNFPPHDRAMQFQDKIYFMGIAAPKLFSGEKKLQHIVLNQFDGTTATELSRYTTPEPINVEKLYTQFGVLGEISDQVIFYQPNEVAGIEPHIKPKNAQATLLKNVHKGTRGLEAISADDWFAFEQGVMFTQGSSNTIEQTPSLILLTSSTSEIVDFGDEHLDSVVDAYLGISETDSYFVAALDDVVLRHALYVTDGSAENTRPVNVDVSFSSLYDSNQDQGFAIPGGLIIVDFNDEAPPSFHRVDLQDATGTYSDIDLGDSAFYSDFFVSGDYFIATAPTPGSAVIKLYNYVDGTVETFKGDGELITFDTVSPELIDGKLYFTSTNSQAEDGSSSLYEVDIENAQISVLVDGLLLGELTPRIFKTESEILLAVYATAVDEPNVIRVANGEVIELVYTTFNHTGRAIIGDRIYFTYSEELGNSELGVYFDGENSVFKEIYEGSIGSQPSDFRAYSDRFVFTAITASTGREMWFSDGSEDNFQFLDLYPGKTSSGLRWEARNGDINYFLAKDLQHGIELWETDGTLQGTRLYKDIVSAPASSVVESRLLPHLF